MTLSLALLSVQAFAGTKTWSNGNGDGQWDTGGNWVPAGAPGYYSDDVVFDDTAPGASLSAALATEAHVVTLTFDKSTDFTLNGGGEGGRGIYFVGTQPIVTVKKPHTYTVDSLGGNGAQFDVADGGKLVLTKAYTTDYMLAGGVVQKGRGSVWYSNHYGISTTWTFGTGAQGGGMLEWLPNYGVTFSFGGYGNFKPHERAGNDYMAPTALNGYTGTWIAVSPPSGAMQGFTFTKPMNDANAHVDVALEDNGDPASWKCGGVSQGVGAGEWAFTNMTFSGAGRVIIHSAVGPGYWWYADNRKCTLAGCTVAPGGAGLRKIDLIANVDFQKYGAAPTKLAIDISNNVCDVVEVINRPGGFAPVSSGASPNRLENCALDLTVAKGDYTGMTFTNLLTSSDLSGGAHFFGDVNLHGAKATINYLNGKVTLTGVESPKPKGSVVITR